MTIDSRPHAFGGIYASAICPMTAEGEIDEAALAAHLTHVLGTDGVVGLLVNGHAGENAALGEAELAVVVRIARQAAGDKRVIAGISAERAMAAARMATDAAAAGADALMIVPPYSWALGADDRVVEAHHRIVAGAAGLPLFLFQGAVQAGRTAFGETTLSRLLEIESVVGIKEGSWETLAYERTRRLTARLRPDVGVMASGDEHLFTCFVLGSEGSIVSLAAILPDLVVALDRAVAAGDLDQARALHGRLYEIARVVYAPPGHLAALRLKTCLDLLGLLPCVASRMPIDRLSDDERAALRRALVAAGAL
jgi:4-hydroxy-tetrahydrodipicolinate synthase